VLVLDPVTHTLFLGPVHQGVRLGLLALFFLARTRLTTPAASRWWSGVAMAGRFHGFHGWWIRGSGFPYCRYCWFFLARMSRITLFFLFV